MLPSRLSGRCLKRTAGSGLVGGGAIADLIDSLPLRLQGLLLPRTMDFACKVCPPHAGILICMLNSPTPIVRALFVLRKSI